MDWRHPDPAISIIIPVFNAERYLDQCLESISNQSFSDFEVLCVNDGSVDGSGSILDKFAGNDPRIRVFHKKNEGQGAARNFALENARGKYLAFVDADDFINGDLLSKVFATSEKKDHDLLIYGYETFRGSVKSPSRQREKEVFLPPTDSVDKVSQLKQMGVVWAKFSRRKLWTDNNIRFPTGLIYEDILVHWQLILLSRNSGVLAESLYHYRVHDDATTARSDWGISDKLKIYQLIYEFLAHEEIVDEYQDYFTYKELETFYWFYDTVDKPLKAKAIELICSQLKDRHWHFILNENRLPWRARDFFLSTEGHVCSKLRLKLWELVRSVYRTLIRRYNRHPTLE